VIFSRGRDNGGRHKKGEDAGDESRRSPSGDRSADADVLAERAGAGQPAQAGPYDIAEAPSGVDRLDLGSLLIPSAEGVEIRVQANPDGAIGQIVLVYGESALQLGVFAAPRSAGIWDEVRAEIRESLIADGAKADEARGEYGTELRARIRTPEGQTEVRFIGVDGPRWLLRAVYQGPAAVDPAAAGPLADCLREVVVNRGREAMPVREALPLRLPREVAEQSQPQVEAQQAPAGVVPARVLPPAPTGQAPPSVSGAAEEPSPNGSSAPAGRRGSAPRNRRSR
jgi:hypothetical protein